MKHLTLLVVAWFVFMALTTIPTAQADTEVIYVEGYPNERLNVQANASTTVITREQLARYNGAPLSQVLSNVAGIFVNQNSGRGSFNSAFVRGAEPNFTQVRINGVVVNDATNSRGGAYDFSGLSASHIERVEIIHDASSALHGSQALSGVINILTRQTSGTLEAIIGLDGDSGYHSSLLAGGESWSLAIGSERPGSQLENSDFQTDYAHFSGDWQLTDQHQLRLNARLQNIETAAFPDDSGGNLYAVNRQLEQRDIANSQLGLAYLYTLKSGAKLEVNGSIFSTEEQRLTPNTPPGIRDPFGLPQLTSDLDYKRSSAEIRYLGVKHDRWSWLAGLNWEREDGRQNGELDFAFFRLPTDFSKQRDTLGASILLNGKLNDRLTLSVGGRLEKVENDSISSTHISTDYQFTGRHAIVASWSDGFKNPSFFALGDPVVGDPNLRKERSNSLQLGHRYTSETWDIKHTVFRRKFSDLIDFDPGPPPKLINRSTVTVRGVESNIGFAIGERWQLNLNQAYISTDAQAELRHRPRYRAGIKGQYRLSDKVFLWGAGHHTSRRLDSSIPTGAQTLDGYSILTLGAQWQPDTRWQLTGHVHNLLGTRYSQSIGNEIDNPTLFLQLRFLTGLAKERSR